MIGHLGGRLRLGTPHRHQGVGDPCVQAGAASAADVLIDRLPHQRVREPVPACRPVVLDDQPGQHGRLGGIQRCLVIQPGHRLDQIQVEPAAGHRGDHQEGAGLGGQPGQPRAQHVPHPHRNIPPRRRRRIRPGQPAFALQQPQQFGDEERVPAAPVGHRLHQRLGLPGADGVADQRGHADPVQAAQRNPFHHRLASKRAERLGQRPAGHYLHVPVGAHHHQAGVFELSGQERQQRQRRHVRPVQVIDDDQQRPGLCEPAEQPGDGLVQLEPGRPQIRNRAGPSGPASSGSSWPSRAADGPSMAASCPGASSAASWRTTWAQGHNAGAPSPSWQRPQATPMPAAAARRAASSASRVFPIPGSPATSTTRPRPPRAPARTPPAQRADHPARPAHRRRPGRVA